VQKGEEYMKVLKSLMTMLILSFMLFGCQAVQKQTDKEAPNQIQQKEGRKEIKKSGGKRNKKETKNPSEGK